MGLLRLGFGGRRCAVFARKMWSMHGHVQAVSFRKRVRKMSEPPAGGSLMVRGKKGLLLVDGIAFDGEGDATVDEGNIPRG